MPDGSIDVGSLVGDALAKWYLRSPAEIEQERRHAAARHYQDFFYGTTGEDPHPESARRALAVDHDADSVASVAPLSSASQDLDPGFSWAQVGPSRFRGVRLTSNDRSGEPSLPGASYDDLVLSGDPGTSAAHHEAGLPEVSASQDNLTTQPVASFDGELRRPPTVTFGQAPSTAPRSAPRAPSPRQSTLVRPPTSGAGQSPAQALTPRSTTARSIAYGALRTPAPSDQELAELRRQQAAFGDTTGKVDRQNSWLAIPALAPAAAVFGLEGAAALAGRALGAEGIEGPLNFVNREAWQSGAQKAAQALSDAEKNALRAAARTKFARANGISAREMQAEVHHSDPLEWAHLKPNADPNRLANLWGLRGEAHVIATREWSAFTRSLKGRIPSQAELMEAKLRIDRLVEPYLRRAGLPRSNRPPGKGGLQ